LTTIDDSRTPVKTIDLLLDTGAFITLITKERAKKNGYKITEEKGCKIAGFSEKGLLCDLRIVPNAIFCGFVIKDVIFATPHEDNITITEVLGMNILENFDFGLNFSKEKIYANIREKFVSQKAKYQSGAVSLLADSPFRDFC